MHPLLDPQPEKVERIVAVLPDIHAPEHVEDWPQDEQAYSRGGDWRSFTDRAERLQRIRKVKAAYTVLGVLGLDGEEATG